MTPPVVPSGSATAVVLPPTEDPQTPGPGKPEGSDPKAFHGSKVLDGILKRTGRVPTHPLTAKPPTTEEPPKKEVTPEQAKKAASFVKKAEEYLKKENFKKALGYYQLAYKANPNDTQILLGLAKAEHATGDLFRAHDHYNDLLAANPSLIEVQALRSDANQLILQQMRRIAPKVPKEKQAEFVKTAQMLTIEMAVNRASLLAHNADKELEGLKEMEKKLADLHGKPKAEKERACQALLGLAMETLDLANLPPLDPKDETLIPEKLGAISKEIFGVLARFAKADGDPALKRLASLFEGYQALIDGREQDAIAAFENVREDGLKLLGDGDTEKGDKVLKEKIEKAGKLMQEGKGEEAEKLLGEIPPGLADAYVFLQTFDNAKTRALGIIALEAWEEDIDSRHASAAKEANGFWGQFGQAYDVAAGNDTSLDKLAKQARKELNLVGAIRERLKSGKCATIKDAVQDIADHESGALQEQAKELQTQVADGTFPGYLPMKQVFDFTAKPALSQDGADSLLRAADMSNTFGRRPKLATLLYSAVQVGAKDKAQQTKAEEGLKAIKG